MVRKGIGPSTPAFLLVLAALFSLAVVYVLARDRPERIEVALTLVALLSMAQTWAAGRILEARASFIPALALVGAAASPLVLVTLSGYGATSLTVAFTLASLLASLPATARARSLFAWKV